jgi:hypothetical protein
LNHLKTLPLNGHARVTDNPFSLNRIRVEDLINDNPKLRDPVIEGWARECEVMNLIAAPKFGKSWLVYYIMFCVVTGQPVFGRYPVKHGRVLLIDLELHKSLIASRLKTVAAALELTIDDYAEFVDVISLRGDWKSMEELLAAATDIMPGEYVLIIVDSKYRLEGSTDENANVETTAFYNRADRLAEITGATVLFVHHQTKGDQSGKRITDVGAGGGAQSRAADTHLVLREHEDQGVAVIEAAVRSFPPLQPLAIRWQFPLWVADEWADPAKLAGKQTRNEERQQGGGRETRSKIVDSLMLGTATAKVIRDKTGLTRERVERMLGILVSEGQLTANEINVRGNWTKEHALAEDVAGD